MKITVTNFIGISDADIKTQKITLIAGNNYSGKTSLIRAAQAALTGQVIPIDGLPKSSAGRLVRSGGAAGEVYVKTDTGEIRITYPEARMESTGAPPPISTYAAGMESLVDIPLKDRAVIVPKMLAVEPTADELKAELFSGNVSPSVIDGIIKTINVSGWDAAHDAAKQSGARMKGAWENISGERYGEKKSAEWIPPGWVPDLRDANEAALSHVLADETGWLEIAISDTAVQESEIERLKNIVAGKQSAEESVDFAEKELAGLRTTAQQISYALGKLPPARQPESQPCPKCGAALSIVAGKICRINKLSDAEISERSTAISESKKSLDELMAAIKTKSAQAADARAKLAECESASRKLSEIKPVGKSTAEHGTVEDCRIRVATAQARLDAWKSKTAADAKFNEVQENQKIIDVLAPAGMRMIALKKRLSEFNDILIKICETAGWRHVALRQDMGISLGGTPYMLCSGAEKWMTRTSLQIATAKFDGSKMILIDEADTIIGAKDRNGLIKTIMAAGIECIIGIAYDKKESVPDMSKVGGAGYWIENGVAAACPPK